MTSAMQRLAVKACENIQSIGACPASTTFESYSGKTITVSIDYDQDTSIFDEECSFGTFVERGTDRLYGYPAERPDNFDGRAQVIRGDSRGMIDGTYWWQPPEGAETPEDIERIRNEIMDYCSLGWGYYYVRVDVDSNSEAIAGIALSYDIVEDLSNTLVEMMEEVGIDPKIEDLCYNLPAVTNLIVA